MLSGIFSTAPFDDMYPLYWQTSKGVFIMRYSFEFKMKCVELYRQGIWAE